MARQCVMHSGMMSETCCKRFKEGKKEGGKKGPWVGTVEARWGEMWTHFCSSVLGTQSFIVKFSLLFLQVGNFHKEKLGNALFSSHSLSLVFSPWIHFHPLVEMAGVGGTPFLSQSVVFFVLLLHVCGFCWLSGRFRQSVVSGGAGWELMKVYGIIWLGFQQHLLGLCCYWQQEFDFISLFLPLLPLSFSLFCPLARVSCIWPSGLWFTCDLHITLLVHRFSIRGVVLPPKKHQAQLGQGCCSEQRPGMLLNPLQCTGQATPQDSDLASNINSRTMRNPDQVLKIIQVRTFLVIQWLRFCITNAEDLGLIPGQRTTCLSKDLAHQKKKKKKASKCLWPHVFALSREGEVDSRLTAVSVRNIYL